MSRGGNGSRAARSRTRVRVELLAQGTPRPDLQEALGPLLWELPLEPPHQPHQAALVRSGHCPNQLLRVIEYGHSFDLQKVIGPGDSHDLDAGRRRVWILPEFPTDIAQRC